MRTRLRWIERGLFAAGAALALWCAAVLIETRFVGSLPVPPKPPAASAPHVPQPAPIPAPRPARGSWVAKLDAPSVHLSATVLEGSDDGTLGRAAGHIEDTALPGRPGNVGIAGHRDTTFRRVRNIREGDPLDLTTRDGTFRYLVSKMFIVNPNDVDVLDPGDKPMLTLVTCFPFEFIGHAPQRYIIQAVLVDGQSAAAGLSAPSVP